jgi:hypothetical protein
VQKAHGGHLGRVDEDVGRALGHDPGTIDAQSAAMRCIIR